MPRHTVPIDWPADFAAYPDEPDTRRAARLGVTRAAVQSYRRRNAIPAVVEKGRPAKPGTLVELPPLRLDPGEVAALDAVATVWGTDRVGALRRLVRSARSILDGKGDARRRFDAAVALGTRGG